MRLRAHLNRRVKVLDLADIVGPVTESNCMGAIPRGEEQLEVNEQSVPVSALTIGTPEGESRRDCPVRLYRDQWLRSELARLIGSH